ncbi:MAG: dipeptidase PepV [Eubacteriales bacterium]|nr:dipeptidase PepV [Eubacteriales bacterium]
MYREKIDAFIDARRQELIDDVCELCRINSEKMPAEEDMPYGPGAAECLDAALDMAEGYGFETLDYDGYVGCIDIGENLPRHLDILAHLDVVPAGEGWTVTEPFEPVEKDGRIYGRGTADDKGPAVAALYAMRAVKELGIPLKKNVRLILGTDEECGSSDIRYYYEKEEEAPMTFSPDIEYPVVNVEKGRLPGHFQAEFAASASLPRLVSLQAGTKINVVPGKAKAVFEGLEKACVEEAAAKVTKSTGVRFELEQSGDQTAVTAVGRGAHASTPQEGINALTGLLTLVNSLPLAACSQTELLKKLSALMPYGDNNGTAMGIDMEDELSGRLTLALSMLKVDEKSLDGEFDGRIPVCGNEENVLKPAKARMAEAGLTLLNETMTPPHHVDGNSDFVRTLLKAYEDYTGLKGECQSTGGGTYVHHLKNGVAFGAAMPGRDNNMHGADEFAVVDDLIISAKIFAQVIVDLCG